MGKSVAESKFSQDPRIYTALLEAGNTAGLIALLTNAEVERNVLHRTFLKASIYGRDMDGIDCRRTAGAVERDPTLISDTYRDVIIPLTKVIEVQHLYRRVGFEPPPTSTYARLCGIPADAFMNYA
jgi:chorismate mutase